jgi:hypothetical protein
MTITSVSTGNVLVYTGYADRKYGVKVLDYVYVNVDGVETKLYVCQSGQVKDNEWVSNEGIDHLSIQSADNLKASYDEKWIKSPFKKGDFLISDGDDKVVFYFESSDKVWRLSKGNWNNGSSYASLASREANYGKLNLFTTTSGESFAKVVDGTHVS